MGFWRRWTRGERRVEATGEWGRFAGVDWADRILDVDVADRYFAKQGRSIARWTLHADGRTLVVYLKRHYRLPWLAGVAATLFPNGDWSPAMAERRHLAIARTLGLPVPRVSAAAEYVGPRGRLQSVLAVDELTDMLPLHEAIPAAQRRLAPAEFARWKRGLVAELARLARRLHERGWFHRDLYLCHFYVPEVETYRVPRTWEQRVTMIDFHRLARRRLTAAWSQAKDLGQLLYSSEVDGVGPRDRLRFWKLYAGDRARTWRMRAVRAVAELRARTNREHNARRPQVPAKAA